MHEYTKQNHFTFGYNNRPFTDRQSPDDQWTVSYGSVDREPGTFREETVQAAKMIRESTDLPLYVLLSGGCDSEVVLRAFHEARIPVRVVIAEFKNRLNIHDVSYAHIVVHKLQLPCQVIEIDIEKFFEQEAFDYADRTMCANGAMLLLHWLMDQIDGFPIIGSGECYLEKQGREPESPWAMLEKERIAALYRHLMIAERPGVAGFFQYTPELMLSFLREPIVRDLCTNQGEYPWRTTLPIKNEVLYQHYPELLPRDKYTGYELVRGPQVRCDVYCKVKYADHNAEALTEYGDLVRILEGHE
jgi:Asparagine synthase